MRRRVGSGGIGEHVPLKQRAGAQRLSGSPPDRDLNLDAAIPVPGRCTVRSPSQMTSPRETSRAITRLWRSRFAHLSRSQHALRADAAQFLGGADQLT
jgi:hypothetical protein